MAIEWFWSCFVARLAIRVSKYSSFYAIVIVPLPDLGNEYLILTSLNCNNVCVFNDKSEVFNE